MDLAAFIIAILLTLLGLCSFGYARRLPRPVSTNIRGQMETTANIRGGTHLLAGILLALGLLFVGLDSYTTVGPRELAVQTAFGKVHGAPLGSGWHWVAPWNSVEQFDASVQTLKFYEAEKSDDGDCLTVRLGNNTLACVDVTAQWNINHRGDVNDLYLQYRTFANIHDNLVKRQLGSALNQVFGSYDPLAAIGVTSDKPSTTTKDLQDLVRTILQVDLGSAIRIDSLTIPIVHFDADTETRLKAFQQAKADTRIAEQTKLTAAQQAEAGRLLAQQPGIEKDGVRYQNCLNLIASLARLDQLRNLPPTWNCQQGAAPGLLLQTK